MFSSTASRVIETLTQPTARGKQKRIGPSELGSMCERCLAEKLLGVYAQDEKVNLAPIIGTAVHAYLESKLSEGSELLCETPVHVGEVRGYGPIKGTMDLFDTRHGHALDFKVVGKKKIKDYTNAQKVSGDTVIFDNNSPVASTLKQYWVQLSLYSRGMELLGHTVNTMSLMLIPRDDPITDVRFAIKEIVFPYNRTVADKALERASQIYEWATAHPDSLDELESDPNCYHCKYTRWKD